MRPHRPVYYSDYLDLERLLAAQKPLSNRGGKPAHDEMLFIIVHQAYELWFKLILHELAAVRAAFAGSRVAEEAVATSVGRLHRVAEVQRLLIDHLNVLETMTPLDFLDFRDDLTPASGFQSWQFRLIELNLGLVDDRRVAYEKTPYFKRLSVEHRRRLLQAQKNPSLFSLVERWLERTPFTRLGRYDFWKEYRRAVDAMLTRDERTIHGVAGMSTADRRRELDNLKSTRESFAALLDPERHATRVRVGECHLSHEATLSALFIHLYRDRPILHEPFRLLEALVEVDELFTVWRQRHALMAHRMIGRKIGTGGSSGHQYLAKAADSHRVFGDLFNLSTYLIPRSSLPKLPARAARATAFAHAAA